MTKRYKVELWCRIVSFHELTVEANSPEEATQRALEDAKQLSTHDWDLQDIEDIDLNTAPYEIEEASDE